MKKKIIIHLEDLTALQEVLLQELLQTLCVEQIEVIEDTISTLLVGYLQIDVQRRQVWRAGSLIKLTPMEFDILLLLARRPGQGDRRKFCVKANSRHPFRQECEQKPQTDGKDVSIWKRPRMNC